MNSFVLIGKPNCGKTLLFNRLTGLSQKVANFPGVTVEVKLGRSGDDLFSDFPGVYSLSPLSEDERVAVRKLKDALGQASLKGILCVVDGTRLERSLFLAGQIKTLAFESGKPLLLVVTMLDEIAASGASIDLQGLEESLEVVCVGISAKTGLGLDELRSTIGKVKSKPEDYIPKAAGLPGHALRSQARELARKFGPKSETILLRQTAFDRVFLSNIFGGIAFLAIMSFLFQAIFTWAAPLMDLVETVIGELGLAVAGLFGAGIVSDFVQEALFGGFGSFLVFVPQIFVLGLIIGFLEDSGYLARAAVICHKPLSLFGLSGKSFVPLLSGHACAIPAIMAARTIESQKRRFLTILCIPLMACSARLPVYSLLIAALVPPVTYFGGLVGLQGLTFFAIYLFGIVAAMFFSALFAKTIYRGADDAPFIIELPPYRLPSLKPLTRRALNDAWKFVTKAGPIIFWVAVVVWLLGYFPGGSGHLDSSYLAALGKWVAPLTEPLGLDWRYGVAIIASFLAREVFVGTLGTMFGIEGAEERLVDVAASIQAEGFSFASAAALLVFYAIALQCVSTLAVMKKELGSWRLPLFITALYSFVAYLLAVLVYQLLC